MIQVDDLQNLFHVDSETEWRSCLLDLAQSLGFQYFLFGIVPDKNHPLDSAFVVSNYSNDWRSIYDRQSMHQIDPTVSHCLNSTLPIVWKPETFQGPGRGEFYEQACAYGLRSGISFPMHGASREFGVFSFVSNDNQHAARDAHATALTTMSLLRDYVLQSSQKFVKGASKPATQIKLTKCELECLKWVAVGKSSWEISRILNRSEATINFHLANIMRKFDVQTRQQAVVKSIKIGLITPD